MGTARIQEQESCDPSLLLIRHPEVMYRSGRNTRKMEVVLWAERGKIRVICGIFRSLQAWEKLKKKNPRITRI